MAVRSTHGRNRTARSTQGGVTRIVMDCGTCIIFIRFRIPGQVYCNKSQNNNIFFVKKINAPSPLTQTWDCLALSFHVNVSVYFKRGYYVNVNENQQPNMQQNTYV